MNLRTQTLLVGLLILAVPVIAWQGVRQLHLSLQQARIDAQTLRVANMRVALVEAAEEGLFDQRDDTADAVGDWYAEASRWPMFVDGYADDWQELVGAKLYYGSARKSPESSESAESAGSAEPATSDLGLTLRLAERAGRLFLFIDVNDDDVRHHVPPVLDPERGENEGPNEQMLLANGDAVELYVKTPQGAVDHVLLSVIAPGPVNPVVAADRDGLKAGSAVQAWRAEWVDHSQGYQIELSLPLPPHGSETGIAVIDVAGQSGSRASWAGNVSPGAMRADESTGSRLRYQRAQAHAQLQPFVSAGTRARLFDADGYLLAGVNDLYATTPSAEVASRSVPAALLDVVLLRLFAWFAAGDLPLFPETEKTRQPLHLDSARREALDPDAPTSRYVTVDNDRVLGTLVPIGQDDAGKPSGYLLFESNEEHAVAFTGSRLARLFALLLLVSIAVTLTLFVWATHLSLRIRRLSRDAGRAVDDDGRVQSLVGSDAGDEIGDLSRNLSALLARSSAYTRYLEGLSKSLSHELGTPLSVVRTSIENVDRSRLDDEARLLIDRASGGADRLGAIIRALVESTRLERSVQHATFETIDLVAWLEEVTAQYRQIYPEFQFKLVSRGGFTAGDDVHGEHSRASGPCLAKVSTSLLQQALDKLIDNACDFATSPEIIVFLEWTDVVTIGVSNEGESLGDTALTNLFAPAASSSRSGQQSARGGVHAGIGLYLVRMIAEAHGGLPFARELEARPPAVSRIVVGMRLPAMIQGRAV